VLEHLFGQEVQDVPVAAGERGREPGGIVLPAQRQAGQLQAGRPALGPRGQRRHRGFRQGHAGYGRLLPQQRRRLVRGEPQLRGAQLDPAASSLISAVTSPSYDAGAGGPSSGPTRSASPGRP
jgi:hypothetical protein